MPWILQMAGFALLLLGIAVTMWLSFWLLVFFFAVGAAAVLWTHLRDYLVRKGILNPTPGVPMSSPEQEVNVTIIEGSYRQVESADSSDESRRS